MNKFFYLYTIFYVFLFITQPSFAANTIIQRPPAKRNLFGSIDNEEPNQPESGPPQKAQKTKLEQKAQKTNLEEEDISFPKAFDLGSGQVENLGTDFSALPLPMDLPCPLTFTNSSPSGRSYTPKTPGKRSPPTINEIEKALNGSYSEVTLLGRGDEATVVSVINNEDGNTHALKVSRKKKKLKNESALVAELPENAHLLKYSLKWETDKLHFFQMPVFKSDLQKYLKGCREAGEAIDEKTLWNFIQDIATGLAELAKLNYVHRDLKPANLLLDENDHIHIADWGLLIKCPSGFIVDFGEDGEGKYCAQELLEDGLVSHKVDIASFGFILLELASLNNLPTDEDSWKKLRCEQNFVMTNYLNHLSYSFELKNLITRMIDFKAENRPAAQEILDIAKKELAKAE